MYFFFPCTSKAFSYEPIHKFAVFANIQLYSTNFFLFFFFIYFLLKGEVEIKKDKKCLL